MATKAKPSPGELLASIRDIADRLARMKSDVVDAIDPNKGHNAARQSYELVIDNVGTDLAYLDALVSEHNDDAEKDAATIKKAAGKIQAAPAAKASASKTVTTKPAAKAKPAPKAATSSPKAVPAPPAAKPKNGNGNGKSTPSAEAKVVVTTGDSADGPSPRNYGAMKDESLMKAIRELLDGGAAWQKVVDGGFKPQADLDKAWAIALEGNLVTGDTPKAKRRPNGNGS